MGRGSSGLGGEGGNTLQSLQKGLYVEGSPGEYTKEAAQLIQGTRDVLKDFGAEDELRSISYSDKGVTGRGNDAEASMNGMGGLRISPAGLAKKENTSKYTVSDTKYGTGAHEGGHAVINHLLKKLNINPDETNKSDSRKNLERATARSKGKLEKAIIKEAKRRYGSNPQISEYGTKGGFKEKVAEAVSDVYANKGKANPYSKVIVGVMKDINSGVFNPKLKVSRKEMGI